MGLRKREEPPSPANAWVASPPPGSPPGVAMKFFNFLQRCSQLGLRLAKFLLTANVEQYFLYNGILYLILGGITYLTNGNSHDFLCNIPPQASYGGRGCEFCSDKLLLCPKQDCWWMAENLTYMRSADSPDKSYYQQRLESSLDSDCRDLVVAAGGPRSMLSGIITQRASSGGVSPTAGCVTYHCAVLLNAVLRSESTDLAGLGMEGAAKCTDEYGVKLATTPEKKEECTCDGEVLALTVEEASSFNALCGSMAASLTGLDMFRLNLRKTKDACYADTAIAYYTIMMTYQPERASQTFHNMNCSYLTQTAFTAFEWLTLKDYNTQLYVSGRSRYTFSVPSICVLDFCDIFNQTLYYDKCYWADDQSLSAMTLDDFNSVSSNCPGKGFTVEAICKLINNGPVSLCGQYITSSASTGTSAAPTPSPSPAGGGATSRRLGTAAHQPRRAAAGAVAASGGHQPCTPGSGDVGRVCVPGSADVLSALHGGLTGAPRPPSLPAPGEAPLLGRPPEPPPAILPGIASAGGTARKLQTQSASTQQSSSVNNDDLPDWVVSSYSQCTCLTQCTEGMQYRSVTCPSGMTCKEPKPSTSKSCVCGHCTDCQIQLVLKGLTAIYMFQGISCLLLWLAFWAVSYLKEDELSEMSCGTKFLGCFCKVWPVLVRIVVYVTLCFVLFISFVVIPGTGYMNLCSSVESLWMLAIVISVCFVLQLAAGIIMKRKPMPPWLHNSVKSGIATLLMAPIRAIGP
uniref:Uncharacterized protein n=1 Tax=Alexandrium monilatum TaxID=311494 RepID=A0A7S4UIS0_9DINO